MRPTEKQIEERAEQLARSLWGYFKGGSAGGSTEIAWFDNNKSLGGPAHVIDLCRSALTAALEVEAGTDDEEPCPVCGNEERGQGGYLICECPALTTSPASSAVEGEAVAWQWRKALQKIADMRWSEDADLDDICTIADRALASPAPQTEGR